jgi:RimJ/RimL family protein N-acetyltransferase
VTAPVERLTDRLLLRQWRDDDREPFAAMNADPEVMQYFPSLLERAASDALLERLHASIAAQGWGLWAVERRDTGDLVGFAGLAEPRHPLPFVPCVEVGWRLSRPAWGNGFATEAGREALRVGFDELGLEEVVSFTSVTNLRSRAVMERLGLSRDPADDFDHPAVPVGSPLRRHVLYRVRRRRRGGSGTGGGCR